MSAPTSLVATTMDSFRSRDSDIIDSKFNELARKTLDELKQSQSSKELFKAVDDILKEPTKRSFNSHKLTISRQNKYQNLLALARQQQQQLQQLQLQQQEYLAQQQQHYQQCQQQIKDAAAKAAAAAASAAAAAAAITTSQSSQPRPLAGDHLLSVGISAKLQPQENSPNKQRSSTLTATGQNKRSFSIESQPDTVDMSFPVSKSATTGDASNLRRQNGVRRGHLYSSDVEDSTKSTSTRTLAPSSRRLRNYPTSGGSISRSMDDDDDGDDDDEGSNENPSRLISKCSRNQQQQLHKNHNPNPIIKSKTLSDTTNISEKSSSSTMNDNSNSRQHLLTIQSQVEMQRQRFNPIVRSSTVSNGVRRPLRDREQEYQDSQEPKSMVLEGKDMSSLYKPHMKHSKSVSGNERFSDDDEIIIIPTQSPSLVSISPDGDTNTDELGERFSISRTKSFWEKLAKGNPNKRSASVQQKASSDMTNNKVSHQQQQTQQLYQSNGNKVIGVRANGHSRALDHMDSTGGSNSNYSCSSSGDETGGPQSHQNPRISHLQEMSRQNRLRQTR